MKSEQLSIPLKVIDHSVSKEVFELRRDDELDLLYTFPKPEGEALSAYYESEDYISHTDGKRSFFERIYQIVKKVAIKNKLRLVSSTVGHDGTLLDIGAGTGDFLVTAKSEGWEVLGLEPSLKARKIAEFKGVAIISDTSALQDSSVSTISMWHVLEHVPDPAAQLEELKRLLAPEGRIFIAVPNFRSLDAQIYGEYWAAYDVPRHLWHFSRTAIERLAQQAALELERVVPMPFDAFYVSLLSEKYRTGRMNPFTALANGLKSNRKAKKTGEFSSLTYILRHSKAVNVGGVQ